MTLAGRLWRETGDARVYAACYDDMKGQVDAFVKRAPDLVCRSGFGDWCAPNKGTWESYFNDVAIVNTSIFCEMARIVAEAARVLGRDEDAARYDALHARAKEAFHRQFYDAKAHAYGDGSQTTAVLPLAFGIVPADCRAAVADQLRRTIREKNGSRVVDFKFESFSIRPGKPELPGLPATYVESIDEADTLEITLRSSVA